MKTIPDRYRIDNIDYVLRKRAGNMAIYECSTNSVTRSIEVVRIRVKPERTIKGKVIPAGEALPAPSKWGYDGWTYPPSRLGELMAEARFARGGPGPLPDVSGAHGVGQTARIGAS